MDGRKNAVGFRLWIRCHRLWHWDCCQRRPQFRPLDTKGQTWQWNGRQRKFTNFIMDTIEESVDMSNLGGYQKLTTFAKKVGGPGNLVVLIAGSGVAVGAIAVKAGEFAVKKGKQAIIKRKEKKNDLSIKSDLIYAVEKEAESNEGLKFRIGDKFKVLECDGDAILIELLENDNNPYFVSEKLLKEISDYPDEGVIS